MECECVFVDLCVDELVDDVSEGGRGGVVHEYMIIISRVTGSLIVPITMDREGQKREKESKMIEGVSAAKLSGIGTEAMIGCEYEHKSRIHLVHSEIFPCEEGNTTRDSL